jgi:hypothetical protein
MQRVFTTAGWVKVDADVQDTVLHGILGSLSKESYLTMPMSLLYLFDRTQDYGWAHAEPLSVVRSRNHLRLWKASFQVHGETVWVGAATHDIGFERDEPQEAPSIPTARCSSSSLTIPPRTAVRNSRKPAPCFAASS